MKQRLDRRSDKENGFNPDPLPRSRTPLNSKTPLTPSNSQLRKKLDDNLAAYEKLASNDRVKETSDLFDNVDYDARNNISILKGKRQNAKNRGFDMKVNNIGAINDKINSLLNMVKKDKNNQRNEKIQKIQKERALNRSRQSDSPSIQLKQKFRKEQPVVSPFIKERYDTREQGDFSIKLEKEPTFGKGQIKQEQQKFRYQESIKRYNQPIAREKPQIPIPKQQPAKQLNLKHLRRKYLPDQDIQSYKPAKKEMSGWWQSSIDEREESQYDFNKSYQRLEQNSSKADQRQIEANVMPSSKTKNIDKMLEERKKKRDQQRELERLKFENSKESSVNKMESEKRLNPQQSLKSYQLPNAPQKSSIGLPQMNPVNENVRNQKINATTKLIDQQIQRIKSKIQESQSNNIKNQKKLQGTGDNHRRSGSISASQQQLQEKEHTARIASKLSSQVELDNKLRQARVAFERISDEEKWNKLQEELQANGMKLSLSFLKDLVRVSPDEHNPFGGDTRGTQNCTDICRLFIDAQSSWEDYVCGCTSIKNLIEEGFNTEQLDLSQKGSLSVEDLVCFVNLYTGHFYRNRDMTLIFRRLQLESGETGSNLSYQGFQRALAV